VVLPSKDFQENELGPAILFRRNPLKVDLIIFVGKIGKSYRWESG
jgi:hypothetical protein